MISLDKYELIFWDFDGVIKESISVKTGAFVELFQPYGKRVFDKVKSHHLENGGMSRFDKIPLYLKWANLEPTDAIVEIFYDKFSDIVKDKVIGSAWVPGVENFLRNNKREFIFVMVSATPQDELEDICKSLKLDEIFSKIYGSPATKSDSIRASMLDCKVHPSSCIMIGDAQADIEAAQDNGIHFIFRRHQDNLNLNISPTIPIVENFDLWKIG